MLIEHVIAELQVVGLMGATDTVATITRPDIFKNAREFVTRLGLISIQTGSIGHFCQLDISNCDDA